MSDTLFFSDEIQKRIAAMLIFDEVGIKDNIEIIHPSMFENSGLSDLVKVACDFYDKYHRPISEDELVLEFEDYIDKHKKSVSVEEYWKTAEEVISFRAEDTAYVRDKAVAFARYQAIKKALMDGYGIVTKGKDYNLILDKVQKALAIGTKPAAEDDRKWESICAADVVEKEMEWLWHNTIPKAKLSLLTGMPEVGKSFFTMMMAARVSSGTAFPGRFTQARMEPGQVLILQNEDGMEYTCKKRLRWEGADMSQIHFITGTKSHGGKGGPVDLSTDVEQARRKMKELGNVKLLIVDPLSAYVGRSTRMDSNKGRDVRLALDPLITLIEQEKVAVVGIMHLNKNQIADVIFRISDSAAWAQVPRVIWMIANDRADPELRWFLPVKNNTIPRTEKQAAAFGFRIQDNHIVIDPDAEPIAAEEAIRPETLDDAKDRRGKLKTAILFLEEQMAKGTKEIPAREAKEVLPEISDNTWKSARKKLEIQTERRVDGWYWIMPEKGGPPA
jgi:hypothetical protein